MLNELDGYVSMFSKIDKVELINTGNLSLTIEQGKMSIKNQASSFWEQLSTLLDTLQQAVIATPSGTGVFDGATISKIKQVQTTLEQLLK